MCRSLGGFGVLVLPSERVHGCDLSQPCGSVLPGELPTTQHPEVAHGPCVTCKKPHTRISESLHRNELLFQFYFLLFSHMWQAARKRKEIAHGWFTPHEHACNNKGRPSGNREPGVSHRSSRNPPAWVIICCLPQRALAENGSEESNPDPRRSGSGVLAARPNACLPLNPRGVAFINHGGLHLFSIIGIFLPAPAEFPGH